MLYDQWESRTLSSKPRVLNRTLGESIRIGRRLHRCPAQQAEPASQCMIALIPTNNIAIVIKKCCDSVAFKVMPCSWWLKGPVTLNSALRATFAGLGGRSPRGLHPLEDEGRSE